MTHRSRPADWRRPPGVHAGTWQYIHERGIANRYDAFVADTPLCRLDEEVLREVFAEPIAPPAETGRAAAGRETAQQRAIPAASQPVSQRPVVVDLGCGTGRSGLALARLGYRVVAIDLSQPMLEALRRNLDAAIAPAAGESSRRVSFAPAAAIVPIRANLVELGCFADHSADHAICLFSTLGMVHGRRHRHRALRHVHRIVRPGGQLLLHVHNRWSALGEPAGLRRLVGGWLRSLHDRDHEWGDATYAYRGLREMFLHRFSKRELMHDLADSGWRIERLIGVSRDGSRRVSTRWPLQPRCGGFLAVARRGDGGRERHPAAL